MGKKGGWFSAVRKAFNSSNDPKENIEKKPQKTISKKSWFGTLRTIETDSSQPESAPHSPPERDNNLKHAKSQAQTGEPTEQKNEPGSDTIPEHTPNKPAKPENEMSKPTKPEIEPKKPAKPENESSKPGYTMAFATSRAAIAAAAFRRFLGKSKEEVAAIKVQTAFRRFSARRKLRSLKGLVRLKVLVQSQSVKRQAVTTLRCMQTLARVQSQVRTRRIRMSEENQALQRQLMQKRERELDSMKSYLGTEWDNTRRSKEQIEARMQHKEDATARRERALAYAQTQQQMWRNPSKTANPTFMDPNNPQWGWSWLDRWMAARPWESLTSDPIENEQPPKLTRSSSVGDLSQKLDRLPSMSSPRSPSVSNRRLTLSSPRGINDPALSPRNRRHSISNSSLREETMARISSLRVASPRVASPRVASPRVASPRVASPRVASTKSTKSKSMIPAPSPGQSPIRSPSPSPLGSGKKGTVEKKPSTGSAKRRMSLSGTPSSGGRGGGRGRGRGHGDRRLSLSARVGSSTY